MAYYGNLALRPERKPEETAPPARQREKVIRRRQLPVGEKLLYLFTVAVCVIVACAILYRYAQIYQMNREIQDLNRKFEQTSVKMKEMQREVERLSDPTLIHDKALAGGFIQQDPKSQITIPSGSDALALNTKK